MTTMTPLLPSTILHGAAAVIRARGWTQEDWVEPTPDEHDEETCGVCILAAINIAAGQDPSATLTGAALDAAMVLAEYLGLAHLLADVVNVHEAFVDVIGNGWNDTPDRTEDEVVHALRQAALKAQEAGR